MLAQKSTKEKEDRKINQNTQVVASKQNFQRQKIEFRDKILEYFKALQQLSLLREKKKKNTPVASEPEQKKKRQNNETGLSQSKRKGQNFEQS